MPACYNEIQMNTLNAVCLLNICSGCVHSPPQGIDNMTYKVNLYDCKGAYVAAMQ